MTTTVVKTIGATGADYTTLQSWEDASPASLVAVDQIWQGQIKDATDSFSGASTRLTVSGTTVSSTQYLELTTATGASFIDNANVQTNALRANASNGCIITSTAAYGGGTTIVVNQEHCRFSRLQINNTHASGNAFQSQLASGTSAIDINQCIIEGTNAPLILYGSNEKIRNSLVVQRGSGRAMIAQIGSSAKAYNCTFVVPSDKTAVTNAFNGNYGTVVIQNCAFFGGTGAETGSSTYTFTTCYTDIASPPSGCTTATYNTSQFVNITDATRDFRLPSGSAMLDVGTTDSTNAATDIAGTSRPQGSAYDVGCWERVSAASAFIPIIGRGPGLALAAGRGLAG